MRGKIVDKTPSRSKPDLGSFRTETMVTNQDDVPVLHLHLDRADPAAAGRKIGTVPLAFVIPAKAGIQAAYAPRTGSRWIPAFAGMTPAR